MELVERVKPNIWALTRWDRIKSTAEPRRDQGLTFSAYRLLQSATMTDSIAPATGERKQIVYVLPELDFPRNKFHIYCFPAYWVLRDRGRQGSGQSYQRQLE